MDLEKKKMDMFSLIKTSLDHYVNQGLYDKAIEVIKKHIHSVDLEMDEKCHLFEYLATLYLSSSRGEDVDNSYKAICDCMALQGDDCSKLKHELSLKILGNGLHRMGELDSALHVYRQALSRYGSNPESKDQYESGIAKLEAEKEVEAARQKLKKELIDDDEKQKKETEDKLRPIMEKGGQEIIKRSMEENIKEEAEESIYDLETGENVRGSNPALPKWQRREIYN